MARTSCPAILLIFSRWITPVTAGRVFWQVYIEGTCDFLYRKPIWFRLMKLEKVVKHIWWWLWISQSLFYLSKSVLVQCLANCLFYISFHYLLTINNGLVFFTSHKYLMILCVKRRTGAWAYCNIPSALHLEIIICSMLLPIQSYVEYDPRRQSFL